MAKLHEDGRIQRRILHNLVIRMADGLMVGHLTVNEAGVGSSPTLPDLQGE